MDVFVDAFLTVVPPSATTAKAGLGNLRMYDLRHHAITVMLEHPGVSEESVEAVAGHISRQMKKRYSHVRLAARRAAVCAIEWFAIS